MRTVTLISIIGVSLIMSGCVANKTVRPQDVESWKGVPVIALDTHSIFSTMPMVRTKVSSGIEMRNYVNSKQYSQCSHSGYGSTYGDINAYSGGYASLSSNSYYNAFTNCTKGTSTCNNIFYIKKGKVLEYAPTAQCYTDERAKPEARYRRLMQNK